MAGIEAGDVLTAINGAPLMDWRDFATTISKMAPNTRIYLSTIRNRQLIEARVVLAAGRCPAPPKTR